MSPRISKCSGRWARILFCFGSFIFCSNMHAIDGAPDTLGIPIIKTLLQGSSEGLKELVKSHSNKLLPHMPMEAKAKSPQEINNLISRLKPKQGKLDPVVVEMLSAFDRTYRDTTGDGSSTETLIFPDDAVSGRIASSTEENGVIWNDSPSSRPHKRDGESNRFSSRYRNNTDSSTDAPHYYNTNGNGNGSDADHHSPSSLLPFEHITDPNIRNHRLYDWEFETYKNFTHIDQAEDLMADEDHATETKVSVVAAPPPPNHVSQGSSDKDKVEKKGESIIPSGWATKPNGSKSKRLQVKGMPHIVISLEDTSDDGYDHHRHSGVRGPYMKTPFDSGEPSRPREPLRHSSTENIVYVHGGSAEEAHYPYNSNRDASAHEVDDRYPDRSMPNFRPSASDLSDAVFMDPEQDFFTSTIRNNDPHHQHHAEQEISSETLPKRRRKKLRKIVKKEEIDELAHGGRFNSRKGERHMDDRNGERHMDDSDHHYTNDRSDHGIHYSPAYSRDSVVGTKAEDHSRQYSNIHRTPGPHIPIKPSKYLGPVENTRTKSDRVLYPGANEEYGTSQGQLGSNPNYEGYDETPSHHHDGGIGNYYSLHSDDPGQHSNLGSTGGGGGMHDPTGPMHDTNPNPYPYKNHDYTSTEYLGIGNRVQNALSALNIFGNQHQTKKLQASPTDQVIAPGNLQDFYHPYATAEDSVNQYYDESPYSYNSWSNTFFILAAIIAFTAIFALLLPTFLTHGRYGKKDIRHDLDEDDLNSSTFHQDHDPSESQNNYQYDNTQDDVGQHPDIWTEIKGAYNDMLSLFRGEYSLLKTKKVPDGPKIVYRDDDEQDESDEEEEDDEKTDNRMTNIRNRKQNRYVKKQQQLLQKQQEHHKRQQQLLREQQAKKTLVSKTKVEAGRDNKDGKTINATSVNNLVVVSGPGPASPMAKIAEEEHSSPRAVTGFVIPDNSSLATFPFNTTGMLGAAADSFLSEWAQVQLIQ